MSWNVIKEIRKMRQKLTSPSWDQDKHSNEALHGYISGEGVTVVEDSDSGTPDVTSLSSSGTANTFGSAVSVDASTAANAWLCSASIGINYAAARGATDFAVVEILVDAASVWRGSFFCPENVATTDVNTTCLVFPIPGIYVPAGSAITAKVADSVASVLNYRVGVQMALGRN